MKSRPALRCLAAAAVVAGGLSIAGCRCSPLTNAWMDCVDRVSRSGLALDHLYCPGTDLTRIGRPDGNVPPNSWICPDECRTCRGVRDVPVPQFRVYPQPTFEAGARESYDDEESETPLDDVELVPDEAVEEIRDVPAAGRDAIDSLQPLLPPANLR